MYEADATVRPAAQLLNTAAVLGTPTQWPASDLAAEVLKPKRVPRPLVFPSTYSLPSRSRLRCAVGPPALSVSVSVPSATPAWVTSDSDLPSSDQLSDHWAPRSSWNAAMAVSSNNFGFAGALVVVVVGTGGGGRGRSCRGRRAELSWSTTAVS